MMVEEEQAERKKRKKKQGKTTMPASPLSLYSPSQGLILRSPVFSSSSSSSSSSCFLAT